MAVLIALLALAFLIVAAQLVHDRLTERQRLEQLAERFRTEARLDAASRSAMHAMREAVQQYRR
jgi:hypothetical protein